MDEFFSFRSMISLSIIQLLYAVGALGVTIAGVVVVFSQQISDSVLIGLGLIVVGNLAWRLVCESAAILFGIFEELRTLNAQVQLGSSSRTGSGYQPGVSTGEPHVVGSSNGPVFGSLSQGMTRPSPSRGTDSRACVSCGHSFPRTSAQCPNCEAVNA